jgi:hypothetical protein
MTDSNEPQKSSDRTVVILVVLLVLVFAGFMYYIVQERRRERNERAERAMTSSPATSTPTPFQPGVVGYAPPPQPQNTLTEDKIKRLAERELNGFKSQRVSVQVVGIKEEGNSARADLRYTGTLYHMGYGSMYQANGQPGYALFTRYNDGRWAMMKLAWGNDLGFFINGPIIVQ